MQYNGEEVVVFAHDHTHTSSATQFGTRAESEQKEATAARRRNAVTILESGPKCPPLPCSNRQLGSQRLGRRGAWEFARVSN